jgi:hypothetical protein
MIHAQYGRCIKQAYGQFFRLLACHLIHFAETVTASVYWYIL